MKLLIINISLYIATISPLPGFEGLSIKESSVAAEVNLKSEGTPSLA